jgi:hypothetical protein
MKKLLKSTVILFACVSALAILWTTSPQPSADQPQSFTFVVFGDNRPSGSSHPQPEMFKRILKDISALKPAFALNTGDCIYGSSKLAQVQAQYKGYTDTIGSILKAKVYLAIGNHEILGSKSNQEFFTKELGAPYYSFDYGGCHFIALDTELVGQAGCIKNDQFAWLTKDLEKARAARFKFVFFHRPMYPVDGHKGKCLDEFPEDRDALHNLFVKNRITAVFAGHEHLFNYQVKNGVKYIITGGSGASLYADYQGKGGFYHYVKVAVNEDKLKMTVVRPAYRNKSAAEFPVDKPL